MRRYSIDEVMRMDKALQQLAVYEVSGGMILYFDDPDKAMEIQDEIIDKFNYFKKLIHNGDCSFEYIQHQVLSKNGPFPIDKQECEIGSPEFMEKMSEWQKEEEIIKQDNDSFRDMAKKIVSSFIGQSELPSLNEKECNNEKKQSKTPRKRRSSNRKPKTDRGETDIG